jgi:hypothetical protein
VYQYRNSFIQAVREGNRNRIFLMREQRHAADFANGPAGVKHYANLLEAVRSADVPEAVEEFQRRFLPLLDPDGTRSRAAASSSDATTGIRLGGGWSWAALVAATLLAGAIFGFNTVRSPSASTPALMVAPAPKATATEAKATGDSEATRPDSTPGAAAADPTAITPDANETRVAEQSPPAMSTEQHQD